MPSVGSLSGHSHGEFDSHNSQVIEYDIDPENFKECLGILFRTRQYPEMSPKAIDTLRFARTISRDPLSNRSIWESTYTLLLRCKDPTTRTEIKSVSRAANLRELRAVSHQSQRHQCVIPLLMLASCQRKQWFRRRIGFSPRVLHELSFLR